ncbi:MAG: guanylate cyclase [Proteobacteria bacterium]|jgi:Response regulator containing a CheY-like receiver domain and an HD-GYP domain|nr:MAG: guanylate cyclase [Pseudomonadota bacterium]
MAPAHPQSPDSQSEAILLAHIRQDFEAPVAAIVGYVELLAEDAPKYGLDAFVSDIARMQRAASSLQQLVARVLKGDNLTFLGDGASQDSQATGSGLRHDLRTPLNAIKGYGEMLLEETLPEPFARDLQKLLHEAERLLGRIDDLAALAVEPRDRPQALRPDFLAASNAIDLITKPAQQDTGEATRSCRILVVDDHESNRDLLSRRLTRDGHVVTVAADGAEALRLAETHPFDLILLDLIMPGISGYEVLGRLKRDPRLRDIPVIMISALDQIDSVVRCIEAGAEDYMPKPFNPVLLRARINASIEKKRLREREQIFIKQLQAEKEKSEALLLNILPMPIVARLNLGETIIADHIPDATILFADLVGFTGLSAQLSATRLIKLLNMLFSDFDRLSLNFGLEKIKTIGDAYMVAGGLTDRSADHVGNVARMALEMLEVSSNTSELLGLPLQLRIGIHTGPVIAGIIGTHRFIYDVWGDTVNTASRMESHGLPGEINVTEAVYERLRDRYVFESRGTVQLTGKGPMRAYLLRRPAA